jgi:predicted phage replisome organizer
MAEVKWIKLAADMFDNRKIKQIRKMPDGDAIIVIWLQILCLAGQINNNGLVYFSRDIPYTDEMLATEFDRNINTIKLALTTFERFGMIEIVDNFLLVSNWEKYQSQSKLEALREYNREKKREYRQKQKELLSLTCPRTSPRSPHLESSISISYSNNSISKSNISNNSKDTDIFKDYCKEDIELYKAFKDFESMRNKIKEPMTDRAKKLLITELEKLTSDRDIKIAILEQSILNNWKSVYALKENKAQKQQSSNPFLQMLKDGVFEGE